jgi:hypothetical protein
VWHPDLKKECWAQFDDLQPQAIQYLSDEWIHDETVQSSVYLLFYDHGVSHEWGGLAVTAEDGNTSARGMRDLNQILHDEATESPADEDDEYRLILPHVAQAQFSGDELAQLFHNHGEQKLNAIQLAIHEVRSSSEGLSETLGTTHVPAVLLALRTFLSDSAGSKHPTVSQTRLTPEDGVSVSIDISGSSPLPMTGKTVSASVQNLGTHFRTLGMNLSSDRGGLFPATDMDVTERIESYVRQLVLDGCKSLRKGALKVLSPYGVRLLIVICMAHVDIHVNKMQSLLKDHKFLRRVHEELRQLDGLSYIPSMNRSLVDKLIKHWQEDPGVGPDFAAKMSTYFHECSGVVGRGAANLITVWGCPSTNNATERRNKSDKIMLVSAQGLLNHIRKMVGVTEMLSRNHSSWQSILRPDVWCFKMWCLVREYQDFALSDMPEVTHVNVLTCDHHFHNFDLEGLDPDKSTDGGVWVLPHDVIQTKKHVWIIPDTKCIRELVRRKIPQSDLQDIMA